MFEWCRKNTNAIEFIFVSHNEVESHIVENGLDEWYLTWLPVPGTRSFHWYKPYTKFEMHRLSTDDLSISHGKPPTQKTTVIMDDCIVARN